jgi:hypothetical protein
VVNTLDEVFVHSVKDLIDFEITKIQEPIDLIPETLVCDTSEPNNLSKEQEPNSDFKDMEENNGHEEEREIPLKIDQTWLARDVVAVPR